MSVETAFVLGAGLGTRLRPLTDERPKPLIPVYGRPLITLAFDHLIAAGVGRFLVNTHHCAGAYREHLGGDGFLSEYRGCPVHFRHEPVLLDTGGGLSQMRELAGDGDLLVYNGDVLADFPLGPLLDQHRREGNLATLAVRSAGGPLHVQCDIPAGRVVDFRNALGTAGVPSFLFTGVSVVSAKLRARLPEPAVFSIITVYSEILRAGGRLGAHLADGGIWMDLGTPEALIDAHREIGTRGLAHEPAGWPRIPRTGDAGPGEILGFCGVGEGVELASGAAVEDCVLWDRVSVSPGIRLKRCIVRDGRRVTASAEGRII